MKYRTIWVLLGALIFGAFCWHAINFTWDDPFISFRYADNLASGKGLVFNEGQHVEGYSNLLWVLISAFLGLLGLGKYNLGLLIATKILGVMFAIFSFVLIVKAYRRIHPIPKGIGAQTPDPTASYYALIPLLLMLTNIYYAVWAVGALETTFFSFLVLVANILLFADIDSGTATMETNSTRGHPRFIVWRPIIPGFVFFLVAITRADGFIIFASAFIGLLFMYFTRLIKWKYILYLTLSFMVPSALVLILRIMYYGDIFPNTYYLKAGFSIEHIYWGLVDLRHAIFDIDKNGIPYSLFGTSIPFLLIFVPFFFKETWRNPKIMAIGFQAGIYLIYIVYKGLDWMGMFRFFIHIFPLFVLLASVGFAMLVKISIKGNGKGEIYRQKVGTYFIIFVFICSISGAYKYFTPRIDHFISGFVKFPPPLMIEYHYNMGIWLRDNYKQGELVAIGDAGAIPYLSKATIVDMMGIMDRHIARLSAGQYYQKFDADYIFSTKPDWILIMGYITDGGAKFKNLSFLVPYGETVYEHPDFKTYYRLAHQEGELLLYRRLKPGENDPPGWEAKYNPLDRMEINLLPGGVS